MEINITWNVCRVCLQEENVSSTNGSQMHDIFTDAKLAKQIHECSGVTIKQNDSLPHKICRKCLQFLKHAVQFRTRCQKSNTYLQSILQKAQSTKSLFRSDKPFENTMDDLSETPIEEIFDEEHLLDDNTESLKRQNSHKVSTIEKTESTMKLQHDNLSDSDDSVTEVVNENKQTITLDETPSHTKLNGLILGNMFLNESDLEETELKSNSKQESQELPLETASLEDVDFDHENRVFKNNYLRYKTLDAALEDNDDEDDETGEMLDANNLETVNIARNDDNDEFFYIFSDETNKNIAAAATVENITELDDNDNFEDDDDNIEEVPESETNTVDSMDFFDVDMVKCEEICREPNSDSDNTSEKTSLLTKLHAMEDNKSNADENDNKHETADTKAIILTGYQCPICGNRLPTRSVLKYHMRIHSKERNFECELCLKRFTTACNLNTHMRTHTGEKPYECRFCERRFADKSTIVKHERTHTDERPYSCTICKKAFTLSSSLKAHERVHTGEKPYSCAPCGKSFKLPHQLKAHTATNAHKSRLDDEFIIPE